MVGPDRGDRVDSAWWRNALAAAILLSSAPAQAAKAEPRLEARTQVGPLQVSAEGRRTVRGGRHEHASIHVTWTPTGDTPKPDDAAALASFEAARFPAGAPLHVLDRPPEPWLAALQRPDLPVRWSQRTVEYLRYFKDDPRGTSMMRAWMRRAGRYEARIRAVLREVGVPEDLAMVVLAESGFDPHARSAAGAAGLWQFMEPTGNVYGLHADYWVDDRFDIEKSTYAAALYLKDLRVRFGSWELALAAFNAGYGLILTTIQRHNTNNFWALCEIESGLPHATANYVPKILAAAIISRNRRAFAVDPASISTLPAADWAEVQVQQSTPLALVADAIEVEPTLLAEYNAHLIRGRTPPQKGAYVIRIPKAKVAAFKAAAARLRKAWSAETTVEVRHGDRLDAIAAAHGLEERELRRLNGIRDAAEIAGGVVLVVSRGRAALQAPPRPRPLAAIPPGPAPKGHRAVYFVTTRATNPRHLATSLGIAWSDIVRWNELDPYARLQPDQVLRLWVPADFDLRSAEVVLHEEPEVELVARGSTEHIEAALALRGLVRRGYRVRKGDTLEKIGRRFGLTVGSLARINGFGRAEPLTPGDVLIVYVDTAKQRGTSPAPRTLAQQSATPPTRLHAASSPGNASP